MPRLFVALLATSVAVAAPAPKSKDAPAYFPTRVGDKREYEVRVGDRADSNYTDVVTKVEKADGALHVTVTRDYSDSRPFVTTIAVSTDGLFRIASNGRNLDAPITLLKLPAKVGTKWELGTGADTTTYTVVKEEEVEVPAGKYKAVRVEAVSGESKSHLWFAPSVGLIKQTPSPGVVVVLKAFTPGK